MFASSVLASILPGGKRTWSTVVVGIFAAGASLACLFAALVILTAQGSIFEAGQDGAFFYAVGVYFLGKAFFVGPMLWFTATRLPVASSREVPARDPAGAVEAS